MKYVTSKKSRPSLEAEYGKQFLLYIVAEKKRELAKEGRIKTRGGGFVEPYTVKKFKELNADVDEMMKCAIMKPCPNCKTPIEKNGGCPQMFCIWCDTRFCW